MKKLAKNEIDLLEIFLFIFLNKYKILFITIITIIISFSFGLIKLQPVPKTFLIKAKIHPISIFENSKYRELNSYVASSHGKVDSSYILLNKKNPNNPFGYEQTNVLNNYIYQNIEKHQLDKIDSLYLFNFFISILSEDRKLIKFLKKNNIIEKEKFQDNELYENEIRELVSSIKVTDYDFLKTRDIFNNPSLNFSNIQLKVKKLEVGMKFFDLVSFEVNQEIKNHIIREFDDLINTVEQEKKYSLEDINFEIENNIDNENITKELKRSKKRIEQSKDLERLIDIFRRSPIFSEEFFAGTFKDLSYEEVLDERNNYKLDIIKFILLGLLLSLIYIMLEKIFKKLKSH